MEIADHILLFYLREREAVYDFERIQRLLQALAAQGHSVCADVEGNALYLLLRDWIGVCARGTEAPSPIPAGVSPQAWSEAEQFCSARQPSLNLTGFAVATTVSSTSGRNLLNGFEWSLGLHEESGAVSLAYLRHHFTMLDEAWRAYNYWLEVVQMLYTVWHPLYGYTLDMFGGARDTPREAILAHQISFLYDLNLFGPELVEALGRERVVSAPAQRVIPLDDGGVLLIPCENLLPDFFEYNYTQVAQHLRLAAPVYDHFDN